MSGASTFDYPLSSLRKRGYHTVLGAPFVPTKTSTTALGSSITLDWQLDVLGAVAVDHAHKQNEGLLQENEMEAPSLVRNLDLHQNLQYDPTASQGRHERSENKPLIPPNEKQNWRRAESQLSPMDPVGSASFLDQESEKYTKRRPNRFSLLADKTRDPNAPDHLKYTPPRLDASGAMFSQQVERVHKSLISGPSTHVTAPSASAAASMSRPSPPSFPTTLSERPASQSGGQAPTSGYTPTLAKRHDEGDPSTSTSQPGFGNRLHTRYSGTLDGTPEGRARFETGHSQKRQHPQRKFPSVETVPGYSQFDVADFPSFAPLIEVLLALQERGEERPLRSLLGNLLSKNLPTGVPDLGHYTKLAQQAGIVELGGKAGASWISLVPGVQLQR
ncbi:hypothetical protein C0991_008826 [Blastosporella zonata]|nr:hypothetical protein C0991_008826 [Blastosporella zonata]